MATVWWVVLAVIAILVAALLSQPGRATFRLIYRKVYAYFLNRMIRGYNKLMRPFKEKLFDDMKSHPGKLTVLEIGVGGGANFKFYPPGTSVIAVDPNPEFDKYLRRNATQFGEVELQEFVIASGENMAAVPDESVDAVVCTLVLCSVSDQAKVISEVKRVLKPGGKFYYLEHVRASPDTWTYSIQNCLDVFWPYLADGCTFRSQVWTHLDAAGFSQVHYEKFDAPIKIRATCVIQPHLMGTATK